LRCARFCGFLEREALFLREEFLWALRRFELGSVVEVSPGFSSDVWDVRAGF